MFLFFKYIYIVYLYIYISLLCASGFSLFGGRCFSQVTFKQFVFVGYQQPRKKTCQGRSDRMCVGKAGPCSDAGLTLSTLHIS